MNYYKYLFPWQLTFDNTISLYGCNMIFKLSLIRVRNKVRDTDFLKLINKLTVAANCITINVLVCETNYIMEGYNKIPSTF